MKTINWKYALGEICLIFVGITLAIAFQNWNEKQKESRLEQAVLSQLSDALQNDLKDINANIATHSRAKSSCENIFILLDSSGPIGSTVLIGELIQAMDYTFLVSDVSTYEYLKSVGLHIIQNDTLRKQITNLYDVVYEGIYGIEDNSEHTQKSLAETSKKYFTGTTKSIEPIADINAIKNDHSFRFDLKSLEFSHQLMIRRYKNKILPELKKLIGMVEGELASTI